jgi:hypothetical protein
MTRPRDCLIIPLKDRKGEWLNCLSADWMLPNKKEDKELLLPVSKAIIPVEFKTLLQEEVPEIAPFTLSYLPNCCLHQCHQWKMPVLAKQQSWVTESVCKVHTKWRT